MGYCWGSELLVAEDTKLMDVSERFRVKISKIMLREDQELKANLGYMRPHLKTKIMGCLNVEKERV